MGAFEVQVDFDPIATGEVAYRKPNGQLQSVFGTPRKDWSKAMIDYLGLHDDDGFPYQLMPSDQMIKHIPAIDFAETTGHRIGELLNKKSKRSTSHQRIILPCSLGRFSRTRKITFRTARYARRWLGAKHGFLAPAVKLSALMCNNRLRNFA